MESMKANLPDMIHSRVEDLLNAQTMDEEITAHMQEFDGRLQSLVALAREGEGETAAALAEDVQNLCARIRHDFVVMAYRQGLADGSRLQAVIREQADET